MQRVGKKFKKDGQHFECISYCAYPTYSYMSLTTGEITTCAANSLLDLEFKELKEEKENN